MPEGALQGQIHGVNIHQAIQGQATAGDGGKSKADGTEEPVHCVGEGDIDATQEGHVLHPQRHTLQP